MVSLNLIQVSKAVSACVEHDLSEQSLRQLQLVLEQTSEFEQPLVGELVHALENLTLQYLNGSIELSSELPVLMTDAADSMLQLNDTHGELSSEQSQELSDLIERIDIEASGGFEFDDDQEFLADSGASTIPSDQGDLANPALIHLSALADSLSFHAERSGEASSNLTQLVLRQQELLRDVWQRQERASTPLSLLKTGFSNDSNLTFELSESTTHCVVHQTLVEKLRNLLDIISNLLIESSLQIDVLVGLQKEMLRIDMNFSGLMLSVNHIRRSAQEAIGANSVQTLNNHEVLQYSLAVVTDSLTDDKTQLFMDWIQRMHAALRVELHSDSMGLVIELPQATKAEEITIFEVAENRYGLRSNQVTEVVNQPELDPSTFEQAVRYQDQIYDVVRLGRAAQTDTKLERVILIEGVKKLAIPIDSEPSLGELIVNITHQSNYPTTGYVELWDGRGCVLIDADEFNQDTVTSRSYVSQERTRLYATPNVPHMAWLNSPLFELTQVKDLLALQSRCQEQLPDAIVTTNHDLHQVIQRESVVAAKKLPVFVLTADSQVATTPETQHGELTHVFHVKTREEFNQTLAKTRAAKSK